MKAIIPFVVSLVILSTPLSAYAHGGDVHIELNVTQAQPGMTIEVRGSGFEPGDTVTIMLMLAGTDRPQVLGSATADARGDLDQVVGLPGDVMDGVYEVRVADTHHVATATISIVADSISDEEGGQRGEEEPLLAPMPEQAARVPSTQSVSAPLTTSPSAEAAPTIPPTLLLSSSLALVVLVVGLVVISRRSR